MYVAQNIFYSLQLDCQPKEDFWGGCVYVCVCFTEVCPFKDPSLLTLQFYSLEMDFSLSLLGTWKNCQLEAEEGRVGKCSLSWNHLPVATGLASDSWAT